MQVGTGEPDKGDNHDPGGDMNPAYDGRVLSRRSGIHHRQLTACECRHADSHEGKGEMSDLFPLTDPDKQVDDREHQARGGGHGPDNGDEAHSTLDPLGPIAYWRSTEGGISSWKLPASAPH